MASFGVRLKQLREDKGLRQEDIGALFDFGKSTVSQWESGKSQPEYSILVRLAEYFSVSVDYLLGREPSRAINETATTYVIKATRFPDLEKDYPNIDVSQYIKDIKEALGYAVEGGSITREQAESLVEETTRYLMFRIKELESRNK